MCTAPLLRSVGAGSLSQTSNNNPIHSIPFPYVHRENEHWRQSQGRRAITKGCLAKSRYKHHTALGKMGNTQTHKNTLIQRPVTKKGGMPCSGIATTMRYGSCHLTQNWLQHASLGCELGSRSKTCHEAARCVLIRIEENRNPTCTKSWCHRVENRRFRRSDMLEHE